MKMTKIFLTAVLLISARTFTMENAAPVAEHATSALTSGMTKISEGAKLAWSKVPGLPLEKLSACRDWIIRQGRTAADWVVTHAPENVKAALTNSRNLKIAGAALAIATITATSFHFWNKTRTKAKAA